MKVRYHSQMPSLATPAARMSQRGHSMSYLQVLGIGTDIGDSVASVGLFFNNHRCVCDVWMHGEMIERDAACRVSYRLQLRPCYGCPDSITTLKCLAQ